MSELKSHLQQVHEFFGGKNFLYGFLVAHGRSYTFGPKSFEGKRLTPKQCYANAAHLAMHNPNLTYVEGKVMALIPIDHAWCIDADGFVIDPTMVDGVKRVSEYFGIAFRTDYLRRAAFRNNCLGGLLDIMVARKTLPKLIELGLVEGQRWLMEDRHERRRAR